MLIVFRKVVYLKMIVPDQIQKLEYKFEIKIEIRDKKENNNTSAVLHVRDYPPKLIDIIEKEIRSLIAEKKVKIYSTDYLPGLGKIMNDKTSQFYYSLKNIQGLDFNYKFNIILVFKCPFLR